MNEWSVLQCKGGRKKKRTREWRALRKEEEKGALDAFGLTSASRKIMEMISVRIILATRAVVVGKW